MASSDGWKFMMPRAIQRRAPFTPLPMPGTSTATSSRIETRNSQGAHFSQTLMGTWNASSAATVPMSSENMWRDRKCVEV